MQRNVLMSLIMIMCFGLYSKAQSHSISNESKNANLRFVGKYEINGMLIQFALQKGVLVLIVPGAPIQELKPAGKNKFKSTAFKDAYYVFVESNGKVTEVITEDQRGTLKIKKIADKAEILSIKMDSLLVLRKVTEHFSFLYTAIDSVSVDTIATDLEKSYKRILGDFKLRTLPNITMRIYPDLATFHKGINDPNASEQVLATAFGKDDIRMVSPNNAGPKGWMLAHMTPHELTHVVHLNIDYSPNNPRWLWEGVAQYEAGWFFNPAEMDFIRKKEFPRLADLNNGMEYMLGFVIIEAIKELWGFDAVIGLIKNQGDVNKVLKTDQKLFEEKVFGHIYKKYIPN